MIKTLDVTTEQWDNAVRTNRTEEAIKTKIKMSYKCKRNYKEQ
jgi:hypothetical protein